MCRIKGALHYELVSWMGRGNEGETCNFFRSGRERFASVMPVHHPRSMHQARW
jgi:hypothetical protein